MQNSLGATQIKVLGWTDEYKLALHQAILEFVVMISISLLIGHRHQNKLNLHARISVNIGDNT
jgi:hypothetical protein